LSEGFKDEQNTRSLLNSPTLDIQLDFQKSFPIFSFPFSYCISVSHFSVSLLS